MLSNAVYKVTKRQYKVKTPQHFYILYLVSHFLSTAKVLTICSIAQESLRFLFWCLRILKVLFGLQKEFCHVPVQELIDLTAIFNYLHVQVKKTRKWKTQRKTGVRLLHSQLQKPRTH